MYIHVHQHIKVAERLKSQSYLVCILSAYLANCVDKYGISTRHIIIPLKYCLCKIEAGEGGCGSGGAVA